MKTWTLFDDDLDKSLTSALKTHCIIKSNTMFLNIYSHRKLGSSHECIGVALCWTMA